MSAQLIAFGMPGMAEWVVIGAIGLLLFGKRLPEVGKSLGKGIVEFKKGLKGIEDDIQQVDPEPATPRRAIAHQDEVAKPSYKFDPYTGKPVEPVESAASSSSSPTATIE